MTPLTHQKRVATKLQTEPGLIAAHGLGSGKTFTAVNSAKELGLPLLAVVPAALRNNFNKEIAAGDFPHESMVVSYDEALRMAHDPKFREFASRALLVFDEGHRMGQVSSARSQLTHILPAKKKLILTGTPIRNSPSEIAPLVNAVAPGALPSDPTEFNKKFVHTREVPVGFWGRLMGVSPGKEKVPVNLHDFQKAVKGKIDFYQNTDRSTFPSADEKIIEVPMSDKQQAAYDFTMGRYPTFAYKIRHGLPLTKNEETNFRAFLMGPRQVSNHPASFSATATDEDAPKIRRMADEIEQRHKTDKNFRGYAYSSFLDAGVRPLQRELTRRGIQSASFTGEATDKQRKKIVEDYNTGKVPVLLLSGAGAEGLDLKGTKLVQVMEPHWQEEHIDQVKGRGARYMSHAHLPENERHVEIQRYHSIPKLRMWDKMLGRSRPKEQSVDEYVYNTAMKKRGVNQSFMKALQDNETKISFVQPVPSIRPGLLVDLDGTLVASDTPGGYFQKELGLQKVLPNRLEILKAFKAQGYPIVGVTNRSVYKGEEDHFDQDMLCALNHETLKLFEGLLDDIIYLPFGPTEHHKPAPTMLQYAMERYGLDPAQTIFTGDSNDDKNAAEAAGIPFFWAHEFFADPNTFVGLPASESKVAEWTDYNNMIRHVQKHAPEFGDPQGYLAAEAEMSQNPPQDLTPINRRCETTFLPGGQEVTRCSTGYHSEQHGVIHVKDDATGHTVSLYRKVKPRSFPKLGMS